MRAFLLGVWEFRSDVTSHFDGDDAIRYDWGREWAHRFTLRIYDR